MLCKSGCRTPCGSRDDQALFEDIRSCRPGESRMIAMHPLQVWCCDISIVEITLDHGRIHVPERFLDRFSVGRGAVDELGRGESSPQLLDLIRPVGDSRQHAFYGTHAALNCWSGVSHYGSVWFF